MMPSDEQLRHAYKASEPRAALGPHPEPEALLAVVEQKGRERGRLAVLDHVMACDRCRQELDLIRASVAAAGRPVVSRSWLRSPAIRLTALAAMLVIVAGIEMYRASAGPAVDGDRVLRGAGGVAVYASRELPNVGFGLAWRPVAGADHYRLEVVDRLGSAVIDSTLRDTTAVVPSEVVRTHQDLTWSVTAIMGDGGEQSSLPQRLTTSAR